MQLVRAGVELDPLQPSVVAAQAVPHAPRRRLEAWFEDGSHRFRAYEYLGLCHLIEVQLRASTTATRITPRTRASPTTGGP